MGRPVSFQDYMKPDRPEEVCEFCGRSFEESGSAHGDLECIRRLAEMYLDDPVGTGVWLLRVAVPALSFLDAGRMLHVSKETARRAWDRIQERVAGP